MTRLVVFDCDGTLVDSQRLIVEAAERTLTSHGLAVPPADAIRMVIGLSLEQAMIELVPGLGLPAVARLVDTYRSTWRALRAEGVREPLFPGVRDGLGELDRRGHLLGVATGKSRPGLLDVLDHHRLRTRFVTFQTADRHPSKPHPAMLEEAMLETGSEAAETVMIGDTSFDMGMARAAGVRAIGVSWGYHPAEALRAAGAEIVLERFDDVLELLLCPTG